MEEKEEIAPQPKPAKIKQCTSQIKNSTTSQNSPRTIQDCTSSADSPKIQGHIISTMTSQTISTLRRKVPHSSAGPSTPPKMRKMQLCVALSGEGANASQNEDHPLPKSQSHASLVLLRNRMSDQQSLKRSCSSHAPVEELSEDLVNSFKVLRMEEPNLVEDNSSTNEKISIPSINSIPIQGKCVQTTLPCARSEIQPPRESTPIFSKLSLTKDNKALQSCNSYVENLSMKEHSYSAAPASSPTSLLPELMDPRRFILALQSESLLSKLQAAMEDLSFDRGKLAVEEQLVNTVSARRNVLIPTQKDSAEIKTSDGQSVISSLGTRQSTTDSTSTHPSSHSGGDSSVWSIEEAREIILPNHSTMISSSSANDGSLDYMSDEEPQTGQLSGQSKIPDEELTESCSSVSFSIDLASAQNKKLKKHWKASSTGRLRRQARQASRRAIYHLSDDRSAISSSGTTVSTSTHPSSHLERDSIEGAAEIISFVQSAYNGNLSNYVSNKQLETNRSSEQSMTPERLTPTSSTMVSVPSASLEFQKPLGSPTPLLEKIKADQSLDECKSSNESESAGNSGESGSSDAVDLNNQKLKQI